MDDGHLQPGRLPTWLLHDDGPHVQEGRKFRGRQRHVPVVAKHHVVVGNRCPVVVRGVRRSGPCQKDSLAQGFYFFICFNFILV